MSPFTGPTPLRYSTGLNNMLLADEIVRCFYKYISLAETIAFNAAIIILSVNCYR
jgi:hypothetical protein